MIESDFRFGMRPDMTPTAESSVMPLVADALWVEFGHTKLINAFIGAIMQHKHMAVFEYAANVMTFSVQADRVVIDEDCDILPPGRRADLSLDDFFNLLGAWRNFLLLHGR